MLSFLLLPTTGAPASRQHKKKKKKKKNRAIPLHPFLHGHPKTLGAPNINHRGNLTPLIYEAHCGGRKLSHLNDFAPRASLACDPGWALTYAHHLQLNREPYDIERPPPAHLSFGSATTRARHLGDAAQMTLTCRSERYVSQHNIYSYIFN